MGDRPNGGFAALPTTIYRYNSSGASGTGSITASMSLCNVPTTSAASDDGGAS